MNDVDCALRPHHGYLGGRVCEVNVSADVLARHDAIGAAIGFSRDDGQLRHGGFGKRKQQLSAVLDDASELLIAAGKKTGHVFKGDERDVERIAKPHESGALDGACDVEAACQMCGLIRHDADGTAIQPGESDYQVLRVVLLHFEEVVFIDNRMDDVFDVVWNVRLQWHY